MTFLEMSFTLFFFLFMFFLFFDEEQELFVVAVNRFFSVRCRHSCMLLLCFSNHFSSLRCRCRHLQLLLSFIILFSSLRCRCRHLLLLLCCINHFSSLRCRCRRLPHFASSSYLRSIAWILLGFFPLTDGLQLLPLTLIVSSNMYFCKDVIPIFVVQSSFLFFSVRQSKMCNKLSVTNPWVNHVLDLDVGYNILCFFCQIAHSQVVYLSHA